MEEHAITWRRNSRFTVPRNYISHSSGAHWLDHTYRIKGLITNTNLPASSRPVTMANGLSWSRPNQCNSVDPLSDSRFQDLWSDPVDCRSCVMCQNEKYSSGVTNSSSTKAVALGGYAIDNHIHEGGYPLYDSPYCTGQLSCWTAHGSPGEDCNSSACTISAPTNQPSPNYESFWNPASFPEPKQQLYESADPDPPGSRSTNSSSLEPFSSLSITSQPDKNLSIRCSDEDYLSFSNLHSDKSARRNAHVGLTGESENDISEAAVSQSEVLLARNGHAKPVAFESCLNGASSIAVLISDETNYIQSLVDDDKYRMERSNTAGGSTTNGYETSSSDNAQSRDQDQASTHDSAHESMNESSQEREAKDHFLIEQKNAGKTYKQIRQEGRFRIAESTLRGRYRNLTKEKVARVRKPVWKIKDVGTEGRNRLTSNTYCCI